MANHARNVISDQEFASNAEAPDGMLLKVMSTHKTHTYDSLKKGRACKKCAKLKMHIGKPMCQMCFGQKKMKNGKICKYC